MKKQKTIKKEFKLEGIGIHTGEKSAVTFKPAKAGSGINFIRVDLPNRPVIPANISYLLDEPLRMRRTSIGTDGAYVHTVEHIMASLFGFGIDNIYIEINGPEPPALDGSAEAVVKALKETGVIEYDSQGREFLLKEPLWIQEGDSALIALPDDGFSVSYTLDYSFAGLRPQYNHFKINPESFEKNIAPSRTFCLKREVEQLLKQGLGKGASLKNTVVVDDNGSPSVKLKFPDEFLRHKVLDLIGDIFLSGVFLKARVIGIKSGHVLNLKMAQAIKSKLAVGQRLNKAVNIQRGERPVMDKDEIKRILPHREPFLLVDEIIQMGELSAVGIKYVDGNEYYFKGHFPGRPIMPGVLILEALAQVGGVLMLSKPQNMGKLAYFMSIDKVKFRKIVVPGDELRLEIQVTRFRTKTGQVYGKASVADDIVCEAELMFSLVD